MIDDRCLTLITQRSEVRNGMTVIFGNAGYFFDESQYFFDLTFNNQMNEAGNFNSLV